MFMELPGQEKHLAEHHFHTMAFAVGEMRQLEAGRDQWCA